MVPWACVERLEPGLTDREIAAALGVNIGTINRRTQDKNPQAPPAAAERPQQAGLKTDLRLAIGPATPA